MGLIKKMSGKNTRTIYMKIQEVGNSQTTQMYKEKEMSLFWIIYEVCILDMIY